MGQEQSVSAPRRAANRLSKPRTNNNSTANLLSTKQGPTNRRNSQTQHAGIDSDRHSIVLTNAVVHDGAEKTRNKSKDRKRMSLFRSKSSQTKSETLKIEQSDERDWVEPSPVERHPHRWSTHLPSRTNSITNELDGDQPQYGELARPVNRSRMSLQTLPSSQHHSRLSLVAEVATPQADQNEDAKRLSRWEEHNENAQLTKQLDETARRDSDIDLYAPIRRRSLLQHGVATRTSWRVAESQQSLSLQQPQDMLLDPQMYYQEDSGPTTSMPPTLPALARIGYKNTPGPRVETPDDMEYGHIGAFKLGSLRITNGTASPSPSIERAVTMGAEENYWNAGSGRAAKISHRRGISGRSQTISVASEAVKAPWVVRGESPLRQTQKPESEPWTTDMQLPVLDPSLALFDFSTTHEFFKSTESPTKSLELANEYQNDLALSPFSFDYSRPNSTSPKLPSKHTADEDQFFDAETLTPKLKHMPSSFDSSYGGPTPTRSVVKGPRELVPKPLAKADSGYSSIVSLRSFKGSNSATQAVGSKEAPSTPTKDDISRVPSSTYSFTPSISSEITVSSKRSLPALPTEELPSVAFALAPPVPLKNSNDFALGKEIVAPQLPVKTPEQNWAAAQARPYVVVQPHDIRQQSVPSNSPQVQQNYIFENSPSGSEAYLSTSSNSRWRSNEKGKQRPLSMVPPPPAPFTIQAYRAASEELPIPPVTYEAFRHLEERVDNFPGAVFPNTLAGTAKMRRSSSKETLGTIFIVGSGYTDLPVGREELTFARLHGALPAAPMPERKPLNKRHTYQAPTLVPKEPEAKYTIPPRSREQSPAPAMNDVQVSKTRARETASQLELALGSQSIRSRDVSAESWTSEVSNDTVVRAQRSYDSIVSQIVTMKTRRSYDSIANGNPYASSTPTSSRSSSHNRPPQVHRNATFRRPVSMFPQPTQYLQDDSENEERRLSFVSQSSKIRSPPPISMQTQGKVVANSLGAHHIIPPSRTPPLVPEQDRYPPAPPAHTSPPLNQNNQDSWGNQANFWAERRKSAGEALQSRKSIDMRRPDPEQERIRDQELKIKRSMEMIRARKSMEAMLARKSADIHRPESARPAELMQQPYLHQQDPRGYGSYDNIPRQQQQPQGIWKNDSVFAHGYGAERENAFNARGEYDHTYGRQSPNKENLFPPSAYSYPAAPSPDKEYYSGPEERDDAQVNMNLGRNTSTSDMLILDRFTGGLDYGYEPGFGLGGSAGTRNAGQFAAGQRKSVSVSMKHGLDFSDVPIMLQRVKIQG